MAACCISRMYQAKKFQKLKGWSIKLQIGGSTILCFQNADLFKTVLVPENQTLIGQM